MDSVYRNAYGADWMKSAATSGMFDNNNGLRILAIPIRPATIPRSQHYNLILQLFQWMSIYESALLYGLDDIVVVCNEIDGLE